MKANDEQAVHEAYSGALSKPASHLARSLTYDQGKEIIQHKAFAISTGMNVNFANPVSPWVRGATDNTNHLIRPVLCKKNILRRDHTTTD
jgi:IS30 family transposase